VSPYLAWWDTLLEFRVKPPREFPKTSLSGATLYTVFNNSLRELSKLDGHPTTSNAGSRCQQAAEAVANAAIKQYILDQEAGK
jgi:hypothetical protein